MGTLKDLNSNWKEFWRDMKHARARKLAHGLFRTMAQFANIIVYHAHVQP